MPTEMRLWQITGDMPAAVPKQKLVLESRLEEWLRRDISLLSADLLVIGQQVETAYGGKIDLLAVDPVGNLVVLELKRDKTPRDIVAQALDYASWVQDLGHEAISEIAKGFLKGKTLEQAFRERFQTALPDVLNERHRMYIVASSLDSATERIVKYLSETHDVDINVATFAYFKTDQGELLGRSLLLDEAEVQIRAESTSKRKPPRSWEELRELAQHNGVVDLYDRALSQLQPLHNSATRTRTNVALIGYMGESKARNTIISIYPEASSAERGLVMQFFLDRLCEYFSVSEGDIRSVLGSPAKDAETWNPDSTWYLDGERLDALIALISTAKTIPQVPPTESNATSG